MSACKSKQHHINLIKHDSLTSNPCEAYVLIRAPRSVVKDEDLGISRCMGEKSRALFALCDCAIYPCTLVRSYLMDLKR
jgi:hypothetical protein